MEVRHKPPVTIQNEDAVAVTGKPYIPYGYINHAHKTMNISMLPNLMIYEACVMVLGLSIRLRLYQLTIIFQAWGSMRVNMRGMRSL